MYLLFLAMYIDMQYTYINPEGHSLLDKSNDQIKK